MPINWRILATGATLLVFNGLLFVRILSFDSSTDVLGDGLGEIDDDVCRSLVTAASDGHDASTAPAEEIAHPESPPTAVRLVAHIFAC